MQEDVPVVLLKISPNMKKLLIIDMCMLLFLLSVSEVVERLALFGNFTGNLL